MVKLHREKGLNPRVTVCPGCRKDVGVALLGCEDHVDECGSCGFKFYGHRRDEIRGCPGCGAHRDVFSRRKIEDSEKLVGPELCDDCAKERKEHHSIVEAGGVFFKCKECRKIGVIKPGEFASMVREKLNVKPPEKCGVEFDKCEQHTHT